jgi:PBSX family phage terminase large subunit
MEDRTIELFGPQFEAFNFKTQFGAAKAGVQSGKTFLGSVWAGKKIQEFSKGVGIIGAPTYKILQQSTLPKFFQNFPQLRKYYKESKGVIELPTGGVVYCRSFESPLGVEGITANWIWLDEAGQMAYLAWTIVKSRVAMTGGQIFISTTPYTLNWLYQEFYLPWLRKEDNRLSVFTWASIDNPNFPKEHFDAEKKRLSPAEFARRYEGEFTKMEGLVYELHKEQIIAPRVINVKDTILGLDFGFHNPAAGAVIKIDNDNNYFITDEYYKAGKVQDEIEDDLRKLQDAGSFHQVYPDPVEPDRVEAMKRHGFYTREVDKNVILGIDRVRELIRKRQLFVFDNCKNTIDEFNSYHYDPEKLKEEPVKENDHLMDAIRYAIYNPNSKSTALPRLTTGLVRPFPGLGQ